MQLIGSRLEFRLRGTLSNEKLEQMKKEVKASRRADRFTALRATNGSRAGERRACSPSRERAAWPRRRPRPPATPPAGSSCYQGKQCALRGVALQPWSWEAAGWSTRGRQSHGEQKRLHFYGGGGEAKGAQAGGQHGHEAMGTAVRCAL